MVGAFRRFSSQLRGKRDGHRQGIGWILRGLCRHRHYRNGECKQTPTQGPYVGPLHLLVHFHLHRERLVDGLRFSGEGWDVAAVVILFAGRADQIATRLQPGDAKHPAVVRPTSTNGLRWQSVAIGHDVVIWQTDIIFIQYSSCYRSEARKAKGQRSGIVLGELYGNARGLPLFLSVLDRGKAGSRSGQEVIAGREPRKLEEAINIRATRSSRSRTARDRLQRDRRSRHGMPGLVLDDSTFNIGRRKISSDHCEEEVLMHRFLRYDVRTARRCKGNTFSMAARRCFVTVWGPLSRKKANYIFHVQRTTQP